jgi:hypothetical protein
MCDCAAHRAVPCGAYCGYSIGTSCKPQRKEARSEEVNVWTKERHTCICADKQTNKQMKETPGIPGFDRRIILYFSL